MAFEQLSIATGSKDYAEIAKKTFGVVLSKKDNPKGRLINPGHAIEAMWFMMDLGKRLNRSDLIEKAVQTTLIMLKYGWDKTYGGIYYFMDRLGYSP